MQFATWSFSEAPRGAREEERPLIKLFDYVYLRINPRYESTHAGTRDVYAAARAPTPRLRTRDCA
tara:strand:- start:854 stop:1048 length:195 start_codon:yes stop_codon:yes gene_type:complete